MSEGFLNESADIGAATEQRFAAPVRLRQEREAAGLHIAALAAALKVPVRKLEALEAGRYDELLDLTFARGLASSACRHLKIDPALVLAQMPAIHQPLLSGSQQMINAPFKGEHAAESWDFMGLVRRPAVLIAGLVLLAALGLAMLPAWSDMPGKNLMATISSWFNAAEPEPVTVIDSSVQPNMPPLEEEAVVESALPDPTPLDNEVVVPTPSAVGDTSTAVNATASSGILVLEAVGDSWVEVVDGAGKVQIQRMMKKGDVMNFSSAPPYAVVLGHADGVKVTVRGVAFDTSAFARNSVARFQVK